MKFKLPLFLRTYNSPFKPLKLVFYFGKIARGVPYFFPRNWIPFTEEDAINRAKEHFEKNPKAAELIPFDKMVNSYRNYTKAVPKKVGFDFVGLGWKTKFDSYRFEFSPIWSFVFFGYQLTLTFVAPHDMHYWECFLVYHYETDRTKSWEERLEQAKKEYCCIWSQGTGDEKVSTDYWELIIKDKWKKKYWVI